MWFAHAPLLLAIPCSVLCPYHIATAPLYCRLIMHVHYRCPFRYAWLDGTHLIASTIPQTSESAYVPPAPPPSPPGPIVEDNTAGRQAQARTYTDLLTSAHDADLLEHYATSQLVLLSLEDEASPPEMKPIGKPAMYTSVSEGRCNAT